jgi:hypothetical protein
MTQKLDTGCALRYDTHTERDGNYTTSKTMTKKQKQNQEGVVMLLAILILSAITAISFSLSSIALIEIRAAGDVKRTEPALYSDQGVTEEAIYSIKRQAGPDGPAPKPLYLGPNTIPCTAEYVDYQGPVESILTHTKVCDISPELDIIDRVQTFSVSYSTAKRFYLYDPTNSGTGPGGYSSLTVKNVGATPLALWVCKITEDCQNPETGDTGWLSGGDGQSSLLPGTTRSFAINANDSYELAIAKTNSSAEDGFIEVITSPKGLPYLSKRAVDIKSDHEGLTRILRVFVPTR